METKGGERTWKGRKEERDFQLKAFQTLSRQPAFLTLHNADYYSRVASGSSSSLYQWPIDDQHNQS